MYLIASNKVRKAKASLERTRPYFSALLEEIDRMFDIAGHIDSPYFDNEDGSEKKRPGERGYLIITADKGLAGAYNQNVIKKVEELTAEEGGRLFVVGEYGRQTFSHRNMPIDPDFRYTAQNPRLHAAREICELLLEKFDRGELKSIDVVYTDFGKRGKRSRYRAYCPSTAAILKRERICPRTGSVQAVCGAGARARGAQLCGGIRVQRIRRQLLRGTECAHGGNVRRKRQCGRNSRPSVP